jgi:limonene-1,2-epoxide hydrolase
VSESSSPEGKVAIAREFVARVFNDHQPELAMEYFTQDMTWHGGSLGTISGAENVTGLLRAFIGALSDLNAVEQDIVASDDRPRLPGRHRRPRQASRPRRLTIPGIQPTKSTRKHET